MHFEWNIYVRFELESWRNILMSTSQGIWSDKSNIRNMQSGGARGLELRTAALTEHFWFVIDRIVFSSDGKIWRLCHYNGDLL